MTAVRRGGESYLEARSEDSDRLETRYAPKLPDSRQPRHYSIRTSFPSQLNPQSSSDASFCRDALWEDHQRLFGHTAQLGYWRQQDGILGFWRFAISSAAALDDA